MSTINMSLPARPPRKLTSDAPARPPATISRGSHVRPAVPFLPPAASQDDLRPLGPAGRQNRRSRSLLAIRDAMTPEEQAKWLAEQQEKDGNRESEQASQPTLPPATVSPRSPQPPPIATRPLITRGRWVPGPPPRLGGAVLSEDGEVARSPSCSSVTTPVSPAPPPRPGRAATQLSVASLSRENRRLHDEDGDQQQQGAAGEEEGEEGEQNDNNNKGTSSSSPSQQLAVSGLRSGLRSRAGTARVVSVIPEERKLVVHEVVISESRYVQDLALVRTLFLEPVRKNKMLDLKEFGMLFSNIEIIEQANTELLAELEKLVMETDDILGLCFGEVFLRNIENLLPIYTPYCLNQAQSVETYEKLMTKKGSPFAEFVKRMMLDPRAHGLPLMSYLIKPVQRLCKYPLLLRELLSKTNNSHPDRKPLEAALLQTNSLVVQVNESKRAAENLRKLLHIDRIVEKRNNLKIVTPGRWFIKEGKLVKLTHGRHQERQFYLFSDILMWTKSVSSKSTFEFKGFVFLNRSALSDAGTAVENGFYITRSDTQKRYLIYSKDSKEKKEWWVALQTAIQDSWVEEAAKEDKTTGLGSSVASSSSSSSSASSSSLSSSSSSSSSPLVPASSYAFTIQQGENALTPDEVLKMVDVENRITGFTNTVRSRRLIKEGPAKSKDKDCYLFLFSDLIILTRKKSAKVYKKKGEIPLQRLALQYASPDTLSLSLPRSAIAISFASSTTAAEWASEIRSFISS